MAELKKYKINQLLENLPLKQNRKAIAFLPAELGISAATFNNYRAIGVDDKQDIPHEIVDKLEKFFQLTPGGLQNYTTEMRPISKMDESPALAEKFGLSKF